MRTPILAAAAALVLALAACSDDPDSASAVALVSPEPVALASRHLASGRVESVLPLTHETDLPEGIALNRQGDIFVGNRHLKGDQRVSEILRITPDNSVSVFARLGPSTLDVDAGVLGLAVDQETATCTRRFRRAIRRPTVSGGSAAAAGWRDSRARVPW
jgi:hypothetical protein